MAALLDRVFQRGPRPSPDAVEESRMTVIEHLEALRRVLIICVVAWGLTTLVSFLFWGRVYAFLVVRAGFPKVYYFAPTDPIFLGLKIALHMGFVLAAPVIIQQVWWFVSPGLHRHERRLVLPIVSGTVFFFFMGVAFALYSLPLFIRILAGFAPSDMQILPNASDLFSFVLALIIAFGIVFELPVVLYSLGIMGIVRSRWLYKNRLYWVVGLALVANLLTPGVDPITPLILFVPLWVFWELTALVLKLTGR